MHDASQGQTGAGEEFASWELDLIGQRVTSFLMTRSKSAGCEEDDLFQECVVHYWQKRPRYDAARGASRETFLRLVVDSKLADIERIRGAEKRGGGQQPVSLDAPLGGEDEAGTLADLVPRVVGVEDEVVLVVCIRGALQCLSHRQRRIVGGLRLGQSKTEISKNMPLSRQTLYEELGRIREVFRDEGLAEFLD